VLATLVLRTRKPAAVDAVVIALAEALRLGADAGHFRRVDALVATGGAGDVPAVHHEVETEETVDGALQACAADVPLVHPARTGGVIEERLHPSRAAAQARPGSVSTGGPAGSSRPT
jgi:phage-related baseplate assembly protein